MRTLFLECFSGISGNMFLGALIDLGLPEEILRRELAKLRVDGYELKITRVQKQGIAAVYVDVRTAHSHCHRHLPDIYRIIDGSGLAPAVKERSKKIFLRLAEAEAKVHGTGVDKVHFHEVGAVDAIVDIVGAAVGLEYLGIGAVYAAGLRTGCGFVRCSHGRMPVPAPATAQLLLGIPHQSGDVERELVTPTGAALLAVLCPEPGVMPPGFLGEAIGYGAGTWELDNPNVLRATIGRAGCAAARLIVLEANIDDMNPQAYAAVMDRLLAAGARDVWLTPVIMKKGRPATKLSVIVEDKAKDAAAAVLFAETTTIGMRYYPVERVEAGRRLAAVTTRWGKVGVKVAEAGGQVVNVAPEYDDCLRLAAEAGVAVKRIWQAALGEAQALYRRGGDE